MFGRKRQWRYHVIVTVVDEQGRFVDIGERFNLAQVLTMDVMAMLCDYLELLYDNIAFIEVQHYGVPESGRLYLGKVSYDSNSIRHLSYCDSYRFLRFKLDKAKLVDGEI